jgi:hypothetical protein
MFGQPVGLALLYVSGGAGLLALGLIVALNWKRAAERYSDFVDAMIPTLPRPSFLRQVTPEERWRRLVRQNRIIFAVFACLGGIFTLGGGVSLLRIVA